MHIILINGGGKIRNMTVEGSETNTNMTGLQPGTDYILRVIAIAADGQKSLPSIAIMVTTLFQGIRVQMYV